MRGGWWYFTAQPCWDVVISSFFVGSGLVWEKGTKFSRRNRLTFYRLDQPAKNTQVFLLHDMGYLFYDLLYHLHSKGKLSMQLSMQQVMYLVQ